MTNLVTQLRQMAAAGYAGHDVAAQAADEIERLRNKCAALTLVAYGTPENPKTPSIEPSGDAQRMEKALGKIYRMAARGVKEFPETFPIGKVKAIAEEALGDRLDAQKSGGKGA